MGKIAKLSSKEKYSAYKFLRLRATVPGIDAMRFLLGRYENDYKTLDKVCRWLSYYHNVKFA